MLTRSGWLMVKFAYELFRVRLIGPDPVKDRRINGNWEVEVLICGRTWERIYPRGNWAYYFALNVYIASQLKPRDDPRNEEQTCEISASPSLLDGQVDAEDDLN